MTGAYQWLAAASAWWWPRFADHLWQTTIFALILLVAAMVLRRGSARWRHTFCLLASTKFIIPAALFVLLAQETGIRSFPILRLIQPGEQNVLSLVTEPAVTFASTYEVTVFATDSAPPNAIYLALTTMWLTGTASIALLWVVRRRRFRHSLRSGLNIRAGREWRALERARESLDMQRKVGLMISTHRIEPGVWRVWRPIIILPGSMTTLLDDSELEAILLHELIHIKRHDNLVGNFQLVLCASLWFHPLVWFIARKLFDEREQACDEGVMEICNTPEAYASSILKVVRFCFGWRVAGVAGAASGTNLRRRIENIMNNANSKNPGGRVSRLLAGALVGLALLFFIGSGVYSRPHKTSEMTAEAVAHPNVGGIGVEVLGAAGEQPGMQPQARDHQQAADNTKQPPSPPPPDEVQPAPPAQPPAPSNESQPAQPAQPTQPPQAPEAEAAMASAAIPDSAEDKSAKQKSSDKLKKGELIEAPQPSYPEQAKKDKIEGVVSVVITIGDEGNVIYAKAKGGPEPLHRASEAAALKARFKPSLLNGKPVKVSGVMTYNFVLDKKE
ncbi:MAG TPA: M56 family metallopeptidase [Pyrinomonadaceae bacterium]|nr:M56 family metallopeptidase [Pyrinomonadaceae bacterium]